MNANSQLAPCPFCGNTAALVENCRDQRFYGRWEVHCTGCFGRIIEIVSAERAIEIWNRRVLPRTGVARDAVGRRLNFTISEADLEKTHQEQYDMIARTIAELKAKKGEIEWEA